MQNICVICGKEFEAKKSTKKYCSKTCENAARRQRYAENKKTNLDLKKNKSIIKEKTCLICGTIFTPKTHMASQRLCCYNCMPDGEQLTRSGFLNLIRKQRGGKCQRCGYDKYLGALDFHHKDPSQKEFTIGDKKFKLKDCIEETKKCVLICANCHRELHANLWELKELIGKEEVNS